MLGYKNAINLRWNGINVYYNMISLRLNMIDLCLNMINPSRNGTWSLRLFAPGSPAVSRRDQRSMRDGRGWRSSDCSKQSGG